LPSKILHLGQKKNTVPSLSVFDTFLLHESLENRESLLAEGIEIEMKEKEKNKFLEKENEKNNVIHPEVHLTQWCRLRNFEHVHENRLETY